MLGRVGHEAGRGEEAAPLAQRHGQRLAELAHHRRARPRLARLDVGQVTGRDAALVGQGLLGEPAALTPVPDERPDVGRRDAGAASRVMVVTVSAPARQPHLYGGERADDDRLEDGPATPRMVSRAESA